MRSLIHSISHLLSSGPWPFYKMAFKAMNEANKQAECMPLKLNMYLLKWLETYLRQMCALCEDVFGERKERKRAREREHE